MTEKMTVDSRELSGAFKALSDSFDVDLESAMLTGGFSLAELEHNVLSGADLGEGDRPALEIALGALGETIAAAGGPSGAPPESPIAEVWPQTPMALRSALWDRGRYVIDAVQLGFLGRAAGLVMSFALMTLATAALMLNMTIIMIALGILIVGGAVFLRSPGAMDKDATVVGVAQNLLDHNVAKMVAAGGRVEPDEARAIIRRLLSRKLALNAGRIDSETVLRPRYQPFRIRRTALR